MADAVKKVIGRNEPCPCGSGKKYKQCCLAKDEAAERARRSDTGESPPSDAEGARSGPAPKHKTEQPWKSRTNTRGFQKLNIPRRSGGS